MSHSVYTNTKIPIQLEDKPLAAAGGEGTVYRVISSGVYTNTCIKIYHPQERTKARRNKIEFMIKNKPQVLSNTSYVICWPTEIIFDNNNNFLGFLMSLGFSGSESLYELTRTKTKKQLQQQWSKFDRSSQSGIEKRLRICINIAIAVHSIHQSGKYAIVDYKPQNILISNDGKISIVDVDSFQISNNNVVLFHGPVATPEYAPPESIRINPSISFIAESWDRFALAVSFYEILFGIHPFAASSDGKYQAITTIGEKIQSGLFVHGSNKKFISVIPPIHDNFQHLPTSLTQLFIKAFDEGHTNDKARPTAVQWGNTIYAELTKQTGIKANTISSPQRNVSPTPSINKPTITSNTPTYTRSYPQTKTTGKNKNNHTTILMWIFIALVGIAIFAVYNNKTSSKTSTESVPITTSIVNKTGYISAKEYANIRNGPSTKNGIITKKYRGESVFVLEKDLKTSWYKVRYSDIGSIGYISDILISFSAINSQPVESTQSIAPPNDSPPNSSSQSSNVSQSEQIKQFKMTPCSECDGHGEIHTSGSCRTCYGVGGISCPQCNGNGMYICDKCNGEKKVLCRSCGGNTYFVCRSCGGKAYFTCRTCNGSGYSNNRNCFTCRGTGRTPCYTCRQTGKTPCYTCRQTGYTSCLTCRQTGYLTCRECKNGLVICNTCQGKGEVSSTVTCTKCEGKGQIQVEI